MNKILIGTLSTMMLSTIAVPVLADQVTLGSSGPLNIVEITPFALVTGAYQGRFENQGIPSNAVFLAQVRGNKISSEDLVQSAIDAGRLSEDTLYDQSYLSSVENIMNNLDKD